MNSSRVAVVDTNVLVSGFLSPCGNPGRIVDWLRTGGIRAGVDDRIMAEYREVLCRPEFGLPDREVEVVLRAIGRNAVWVEVVVGTSIKGLPDMDDAPFAECALTLGACLVTCNKRHFPGRMLHGLNVVSPLEFIAMTGI